MRVIVSILLLVVLLPVASAFGFTSTTGEPLQELNVLAEYTSGSTFFYIAADGASIDQVAETPVRFILDDVQTQGRDYATELLDVVDETIIAYPIGTLQGTVVDRYDNAVGAVEVRLSCLGLPVLAETATTNEFGFFSVDVPAGTCTLHARHNDVIGSAQIIAEQGGLSTVTLKVNSSQVTLQTTPDSGLSMSDILIILVLLLVVIIILFSVRSLKSLHENEPTEHSSEENKNKQHSKAPADKEDVPNKRAPKALNDKAQGVLKTLNEREKQIITTLLEKGQQSQTQLQYATGLPKATVSRIVQKLSTTEVIEVKEYGKTKKISLSDWFQEQ